jgi:hypothetical protein
MRRVCATETQRHSDSTSSGQRGALSPSLEGPPKMGPLGWVVRVAKPTYPPWGTHWHKQNAKCHTPVGNRPTPPASASETRSCPPNTPTAALGLSTSPVRCIQAHPGGDPPAPQAVCPGGLHRNGHQLQLEVAPSDLVAPPSRQAPRWGLQYEY